MSICQLFNEVEKAQFLVAVSVNGDTEWDDKYIVKVDTMATEKHYSCIDCFHNVTKRSVPEDCLHFKCSLAIKDNEKTLDDIDKKARNTHQSKDDVCLDKSVCELNLTLPNVEDLSAETYKDSIINNLFRFLALKSSSSMNPPQFGGEIAETLMKQQCEVNGINSLIGIKSRGECSLNVYVESAQELHEAEKTAFQAIKYERKKHSQSSELTAIKLISQTKEHITNILYCLNDRPFLSVKLIFSSNESQRISRGIQCNFKAEGSSVPLSIYFINSDERELIYLTGMLSYGCCDPNVLRQAKEFIDHNCNNDYIDGWRFTVLVTLWRNATSQADSLLAEQSSEEHLPSKQIIQLNLSSLCRRNQSVVEVQMSIKEAFYSAAQLSPNKVKGQREKIVTRASDEYNAKSLTKKKFDRIESRVIEETFIERFGNSEEDEAITLHKEQLVLFVSNVCHIISIKCGELYLLERQGYIQSAGGGKIPYIGELRFLYSSQSLKQNRIPSNVSKESTLKLKRYEDLADCNYSIAVNAIGFINQDTVINPTKRLQISQIISTSILKYIHYSGYLKNGHEKFRELLHSLSIAIVYSSDDTETSDVNAKILHLLSHTLLTMISTSSFQKMKHESDVYECMLTALSLCLKRGIYTGEFEICFAIISSMSRLKSCLVFSNETKENESFTTRSIFLLSLLQTVINYPYQGSPEHYNAAVILLDLVNDFLNGYPDIDKDKELQISLVSAMDSARKVQNDANSKGNELTTEILAQHKVFEDKFDQLETKRSRSKMKTSKVEASLSVDDQTGQVAPESIATGVTARTADKEYVLSAWEVELGKAIRHYRKGDTRKGNTCRDKALLQSTTNIEKAQIWTDATSADIYSSRKIIQRACFLGRKCKKLSDEISQQQIKMLKEIPDQSVKVIDIESSRQWLKVNPLVQVDELVFFSSQFSNFAELKKVSDVIERSIAGYHKALEFMSSDSSSGLALESFLLEKMILELKDLNEQEQLIRKAKENLLSAMERRLSVLKWLGLHGKQSSIKLAVNVQSQISLEKDRLRGSTDDLSLIFPPVKSDVNLKQLIDRIHLAEIRARDRVTA